MRHPVLDRHHVQLSGPGTRTLVFAHGFGCHQGMWRFVAPRFEAGWRVATFDHAGAGAARGAWDARRHATLEGYAEDLLAVLDALDVRDAVVVGHSVGATIAMLAAARDASRVAALALVAPSPCYENRPPSYRGGFSREDLERLLDLMERNYAAWVDALAPTIVGSDDLGADTGARTRELRDSILATDRAVIRAFARATFLEDHRAVAARIGVPTLVLQCAADAIAPESAGRWLADHLPRGRFHQLAARGHCPHLTHPTETVAALRQFLERAVAPSAPAAIPASAAPRRAYA